MVQFPKVHWMSMYRVIRLKQSYDLKDEEMEAVDVNAINEK